MWDVEIAILYAVLQIAGHAQSGNGVCIQTEIHLAHLVPWSLASRSRNVLCSLR